MCHIEVHFLHSNRWWVDILQYPGPTISVLRNPAFILPHLKPVTTEFQERVDNVLRRLLTTCRCAEDRHALTCTFHKKAVAQIQFSSFLNPPYGLCSFNSFSPVFFFSAIHYSAAVQYLREDLAKRGLAVAGVPTPRKPASSASGTAPTGAGAAPGAAPVAPSVLASPGQRHSYKVPSPANKLTSAGTAGADGSAKPRGRLASLGPTDKQQSLPSHAFSSPPQASPQSEADYSSASTASLSSLSVSSSSAAGVRPRPGKLSASRFGSFQKTEEATAASSSALPKPPPSSLPNAESTSSSADASGKGSVPQNGSQNDSRSDSLRSSSGSRRWTVGPSSSPSAEPLQAAERTHGEKEEVETPSAGSSVTVTPPQTPPGEKAKSTGAGLQSKSGQSSPVYGKQGAAVTSSGTTRSVGKRSASGKIAALARRFEKQADVEGDIAAETE